VIDRIAETMIPVALNNEIVKDSATRESRFLVPLLKGHMPPWISSQYVLSPDGKVLAKYAGGYSNMAGSTKKMIDEGLAAFGSVEPRKVAPVETHPNRGKGILRDGSACLAEYVRARGNTNYLHGISTPVMSSVTLSEKEFRALAPRDPAPGAEWTVPEAVARRFCRLTNPLCAQHAPQPEWVTRARLTGKVRSVQDGVARLNYEGSLASVSGANHRKGTSEGEVTLTGEGVYDVTGGKLRSLMIVGSGSGPFSEGSPDVRFEALLEWTIDPQGRN